MFGARALGIGIAALVGCAFESGGLGSANSGTDSTGGSAAGSSGGASSAGNTGTTGNTGNPSTSAGSSDSGASSSTTTTDGGSSSGPAPTTGGSGPGSTSTGGGAIFEFPTTQDTFINQAAPAAQAGLDASLRVGSGSSPDRATRTLVQADLQALPKCDIAFAELFLYYYADGEPAWAVENTTINAYEVTTPWTEIFASWNQADTLPAWAVQGGDFDPTVLDSNLVAGGNFSWISWDITVAAKQWCDDPGSNLGIMLAQPADLVGSSGRKHFIASDDWMNEGSQPLVRVTLTP